ncbi:MAG: lactonase family protein, partial [Bauldia sp.]|nr:lactonase family protein [Bauldia sp.]
MSQQRFVFVGCLNREAPYFQGARGKGIAAYAFDAGSGEARLVAEVEGIDNPTYLTVHPTNGCIYATSEVFGWNEGTVSAYRFDADKGRLVYLNKQPTLGSIAAHASFDRTARFLLVANYSIGGVDDLPGKSIAVFPVRADGSLDPAVASAAHATAGSRL